MVVPVVTSSSHAQRCVLWRLLGQGLPSTSMVIVSVAP